MKPRYPFLFFFTLLMLPQIARGELSYIGSSTIGTGILNAGAVEAFRIKSGKRFSSVQIPGSGIGINALREGETELAGVARPLKAKEKALGLSATVIGYDAIALFVHVKNPVSNLSIQELKGIFSGRVSNWRMVGGKPAPIEPTTEIRLRERATMEVFRDLVLGDTNYGDFRQVDLPRDQLLQIARNPNGICVASTGLLASLPAKARKNIKAVSVNGIEATERNVRSGAYPISRPLLLVTKGSPKGDTEAFIRFLLSPEGQRIVDRNFIPVSKKR